MNKRGVHVKKYIKLFRLKSWSKNALIFLPLFFHGAIFELPLLLNTAFAFITFCLASSFIYIINDIKDIDLDLQHPIKKNRPIASGEVSIKNAHICAAVLCIITVFLSVLGWLQFNYRFALIIFTYIVLNLIYCFGAKHIPLLDVFILSAGFLLRLFIGALVTNIAISDWLYLTVLCGSLYLSFLKRKKEYDVATSARLVLSKYSAPFLRDASNICLTLSIAFYSLWCIDNNPLYKFTIPIFLFIIFKYNLNIEKGISGDPVENIFGDKLLLFLIGMLGISLFFIQYIPF